MEDVDGKGTASLSAYVLTQMASIMWSGVLSC